MESTPAIASAIFILAGLLFTCHAIYINMTQWVYFSAKIYSKNQKLGVSTRVETLESSTDNIRESKRTGIWQIKRPDTNPFRRKTRMVWKPLDAKNVQILQIQVKNNREMELHLD